MTVICPIPKSPHQRGRIGDEQYQDWYRSLETCAQIARTVSNPQFLIITGFHAEGSQSEADIYRRVLSKLAPEIPIETLDAGFETIEQTEAIARYASRTAEPIVIVSTFLHAPRVRYLTRELDCEHYAVLGIPRPREVLTDTVLTVAMPVIDLLGLRSWFKRRIEDRRKTGAF